MYAESSTDCFAGFDYKITVVGESGNCITEDEFNINLEV